MENSTRFIYALISFIIPVIGIALYFSYRKKQDAKIFGVIAIIGIFVYIGVGIGFI